MAITLRLTIHQVGTYTTELPCTLDKPYLTQD